MRILKNPKRAVRWYVGLCLIVFTHCFVACSTQHPEVEKAAQTHLEQWKEYYVVALQTGGCNFLWVESIRITVNRVLEAWKRPCIICGWSMEAPLARSSSAGVAIPA